MLRKLIYLLIYLIPIAMLAQPRIHFDTTAYDFGEIIQGRVFTKEIKLTNTGNQPLIIMKVTTGDGGSHAEFPKAPIEPGKSAVIVFNQITIGREGWFSRYIYIHSNAESDKNSGVSIRGKIISSTSP